MINETIRKQITDWVLFAAPVAEGLNQLELTTDGHCSSRRWLWLVPDTALLQRVVPTQPKHEDQDMGTSSCK